jgi:hypothetical protein
MEGVEESVGYRSLEEVEEERSGRGVVVDTWILARMLLLHFRSRAILPLIPLRFLNQSRESQSLSQLQISIQNSLIRDYKPEVALSILFTWSKYPLFFLSVEGWAE